MNEWVSVDERLPLAVEHPNGVLVVSRYGVHAAEVWGKGRDYFRTEDGEALASVTYWMAFPPPPA